MTDVLLRGVDEHDLVVAVIRKNGGSSCRQFCLHVESKAEALWLWTACACDASAFVVSGSAATRVEAISAAEHAVDSLHESMAFIEGTSVTQASCR